MKALESVWDIVEKDHIKTIWNWLWK